MEHNPAFKPTTRFTAIFPKVSGFVWVDESAANLRASRAMSPKTFVGCFWEKIYKGKPLHAGALPNFCPGCGSSAFRIRFRRPQIVSSFSVHERAFYSNYHYIGPPNEALAAIRQELGAPSWTSRFPLPLISETLPLTCI